MFENEAWRVGNAGDCSLGLRGCTTLRQDTVGLGSDKVWRICDAQSWRNATDIEKDTATWGDGNFDGEVRAGQVNENTYYIYETVEGYWREATTLEKDTYDYEKDKDWTAGNDGEIKKGSVTDSIYVFDATAWRTADAVESVLGGCFVKRQLERANIYDEDNETNHYYTCYNKKWYDGNDWTWDLPKEAYLNPEIEYDTIIDARDGRSYKTVKIGEQVWMAENLNYADSVATPSLKGRSRCYDDVAKYCDVAGRLYTWAAAIDSVKIYKDTEQECGHKKVCSLKEPVRGNCPENWHLPSQGEWQILIEYVGGMMQGLN